MVTRAVSAVLLAATLGCATSPTEPPHARNIVIVTLDTTRADYLSAYGSARASTPNLDALAAGGVVFEHATSSTPLTLPSHCSLFTGLLPSHHGVRDNGAEPLAATHPTSAELLRSRGFRTAAFVGSVVLGRDRGLARGFDVYGDGVSDDGGTPGQRQRPGNQVMDDALSWLEKSERAPFFLWIHLYDAHAPYEPPEPYRSMYTDDLYAGEIAFADLQFGRLLDALARRRVIGETALIVAADHGESLGDHGERGHGIFLYESAMHVPLVVRAPGVAPRRVAGLTRLVDVMPTLLALARVPAPPSDGVSLVGAMTGTERLLDRDGYSESLYPRRFGWSPLRALRDERFKFIEAPRPELYDLETDPFELRNLIGERPALAHAMSRRLSAIGGLPAPDRPDAAVPTALSPNLRERLAGLGYAWGGPPPNAPAGTSLPDPKDRIGQYNDLTCHSRQDRHSCRRE